MAVSVLADIHGPDWPLGFISVAVPGTPVGLMSVVDPTSKWAPNTPTASGVAEYTARCKRIFAQAFKPNAVKLGGAPAMIPNTGYVYIVRYDDRNSGGSGDRYDTGTLVMVIAPGSWETIPVTAAELDQNVLSPYRYYVDADNAGDGIVAGLLIGG